MLYLSLYFKTHRQHYYELLNNVRQTGDAEAVTAMAIQAVETAQMILDILRGDHAKIVALGRAATSAG